MISNNHPGASQLASSTLPGHGAGMQQAYHPQPMEQPVHHNRRLENAPEAGGQESWSDSEAAQEMMLHG